jgi:hypothetical protein
MANETKMSDMIMTIGRGVMNMIMNIGRIEVDSPVKKLVGNRRVGSREGKIIPSHSCDCDICGETKLTLSVTCPYCNFTCCKTCFDTYLLTTTGDAKCMSCKAIFDLTIVWKLCITSVTYKKYLDFRLDQLMQKEKSHFQESIVQIEREKILSSIASNSKKMRVRGNLSHIDEIDLEEELMQNIFITHCSVVDCKGTLNKKWNCRLCDACHCNKCGELKTGTHVCNPNSVQNLEEIKKNSKPCPTCGVAIFKTDGCDQMFCIVCHTAFSWTTLKIETGRIHNPHYYEIMRKNGNFRRDDGDVRPCDELVYHLEERHQLYDAITSEFEIAQKSKFTDAPRFITELDSRDWNETSYIFGGQTFADIRKQFLKNEISDGDYRRRMKLKFNKFTKMHEVCQILALTKIAMSEELKQTIRNDDGSYINIGDIYVTELRKRFMKYITNIDDIMKNTNEMLYQAGLKYSSFYEIMIDSNFYRVIIKKKL